MTDREQTTARDAERIRGIEKENARLRAAIRQIANMSPRAGGVGQIARDEMRLWESAESP